MLKFKSTRLLGTLEALRARYSGNKISARIVVSDDMKWWFFQEFGTATKFNGDSPEIPPTTTQVAIPTTNNPQGYEIHPDGAGAIRLPGRGALSALVVPFVGQPWTLVHPGVPPKLFIRRILSEVHTMATTELIKALIAGGYTPEAVKESLMDEVMPAVLEMITTSMDEVFYSSDDRDTPGKLGSMQPSAAFRSGADIIDSSSG